MTINFDWTVNNIDSYPLNDTYVSASYNVDWTCVGACELTSSNLDIIEYTASESGVTLLTIESGSIFVPQEDLIMSNVIADVQSTIGADDVDAIEMRISESIQQQYNMDTTIDFAWTVVALESYPTYDIYEDVIFNVHWDCRGTYVVSGSGTYTSNSIGVQELTLQSGSVFVAYNDLNEQTVISWVHSAMGNDRVRSIKSNISGSIADKVTPRILKLPLPWSQA